MFNQFGSFFQSQTAAKFYILHFYSKRKRMKVSPEKEISKHCFHKLVENDNAQKLLPPLKSFFDLPCLIDLAFLQNIVVVLFPCLAFALLCFPLDDKALGYLFSFYTLYHHIWLFNFPANLHLREYRFGCCLY